MRSALPLLVGAVLIAAWTAPSAAAQAAAAPQLTLAPLAGPPGATVTASGSGFCAARCSAVDISFGGATVRTGIHVGSAGRFHTTFTVPAAALGGANNVFAEQRDASGSDRQASAAFQVTPSTPVNGSTSKRHTSAPRHRGPPRHTSAPTRTKSRSSRQHGTPPPPTTAARRHATSASDAAPSTTPAANAAAAAASGRGDGGFSRWWWIPIGIAVAAATAGVIIWRRRATG